MNAIDCMWSNKVKIFANISACRAIVSEEIERTNATHDKNVIQNYCFHE